jgi:glutathione transport system permease protein
LQFGGILGQAVVIEKLFSWPGLGSLLVDSVSLRDIPVVQGTILAIVLFFLFVNTLVDVLCAAIDPRIQLT